VTTENRHKKSRPTIMVDPEDSGTQTGTQLPPPPDWKPTPVVERFHKPIDPEGDCCILDDMPCILFGQWDYAEDWSGEFVREMHPFELIGAPKVTVEEFWKLVVALHSEAPQSIRVLSGCHRRKPKNEARHSLAGSTSRPGLVADRSSGLLCGSAPSTSFVVH
jgi:hypothetical protein